MSLPSKTPSESRLQTSELVLPEHTNLLNQLLGGKLMYWIDIGAFIVAQRHSNSPMVTASMDNLSFRHPIELGHVVTLKMQVTRSFRTSMEVYVRVHSENIVTGERFESNAAFLTFVALDENKRPKEVPSIRPETDEEKELYAGAARRRRLRLLLAKSDGSVVDKLLDGLE